MVEDDGRSDGTGDTLLSPAAATGDTLLAPSTHPHSSRPRSAPVDLDSSRYRMSDVLGHGGMGEVILAVDEQIGREVAVKRIRSETPTPDEVDRFVREARVQARLEHPAVVPVHDIAIDRSGKPFFVMKRLAGTVMKDLLAELATITPEEAAAVRLRLLRAFVDVCLAIEFAHQRGIIHRDLKPANIMLGEYGEVYVLDWGIARAVAGGDDIPEGTIIGTPAYMAPEQLIGQRAGTPADIYALGCILYEIAAGVPLHDQQRTAASAILASEHDAFPSLRRPESPPELDAICACATELEQARRYPSARALGDAVQAYLDGHRDVAARRELAQRHIAEARAAQQAGDRKLAMRAAGRALALDPTASEAAELVTHLVLVPPTEIPAEVDRELEVIDVTTARSQARLGAVAMTGYLMFVPLLWWTGVRDWNAVVAFAAAAIVSAVQIYMMSRQQRIPLAAIYTSAVINAVLIGLVCRLVGPFVIAPTLVLTTLMAFAVHPRFGRMPIVACILSLGVAVPWLLEAIGVLAPTYHFAGGSIVLSSPAVTFSPVPVQLAFALVLGFLAAVTAVLLRSMALRQRAVTKQLELQAWHLRQLVATR